MKIESLLVLNWRRSVNCWGYMIIFDNSADRSGHYVNIHVHMGDNR